MDSTAFCPLVDQITLHEGCFKKNPLVFEKFEEVESKNN